MEKNNQKDAILKITLNSDSGYESKEEHNISPDQWGKIQGILHDVLPPPAGSKFSQAYKLLCEELQSFRREFFQAKKIELTTKDKTRCNELEAQIKEVDKIVKFIDEQQGRWTDPQTGNYQGVLHEKEVLSNNMEGKEIIIEEGFKTELQKLPDHIHFDFDKSWLLVCSYLQPHTKQRNYKNILVKQDQFPTLQQCQTELEKDLGFEVEEVVLMNWKEVNNNYEL